MYTYQVEHQDERGREYVKPYGVRRQAAQSAARRLSDKHCVAYVVACRQVGRHEEAVGHKVYGQGSVIETEGEGF